MPKIVADSVVFEAILKTVTAHGYSGSTTKMIAEAADVNEATLFRKYGSKDQMVLKAMTHLFTKVDVDTLVQYTGDTRADLMRILNNFFEVEKENGRLFMVLISALPNYPELQPIAQFPLTLMMKIGQVLARYQADGVLRQEHPFQAALTFMGPIVIAHRIQEAGVSEAILNINPSVHIDAYLHGRAIVERDALATN